MAATILSITGGLMFYGGACTAAYAPPYGWRMTWGWRAIAVGAAILAAGTIAAKIS